MKTPVAVVLLSLLSSPVALAGSAPGALSCQQVGGGVTLQGLIPAVEVELDLTLSDGKTSRKVTNDQAEAYVVEAFEQGVFTLIVAGKGVGTIQLYALPKTVKATKKSGEVHAKFQAVLESPKPERLGAVRSAGDMLQNVKMSCQYDYEI
jgi:hypothetical protein